MEERDVPERARERRRGAACRGVRVERLVERRVEVDDAGHVDDRVDRAGQLLDENRRARRSRRPCSSITGWPSPRPATPAPGNTPAWPRYSSATDMLMDFTENGPVAERIPNESKARCYGCIRHKLQLPRRRPTFRPARKEQAKINVILLNGCAKTQPFQRWAGSVPVPNKAIHFSCWCNAGVDKVEDRGNKRRAAVMTAPAVLFKNKIGSSQESRISACRWTGTNLLENLAEPAKRPIARLMRKPVVDLLQSVEVKQSERELAAASLGSANFCVEHLEETAVIRQAGERIARRLMAQLVFQRPLLGDVDRDDFMAGKVPVVVESAVAADPGFQDGAVFPLPFRFDRLKFQAFAGLLCRRRSLAEIRKKLCGFTRRQEFLFACVAEHVDESLVDVKNFPFRVAPVYSVCGVVH